MALATLSIDLVAKLANLQTSLDKAGRIAEKDSARMAKAFNSARAAAAGIGGALVAGLSVGAVTQFVKGSIDGADAAIKQARSVGVLTEEITALNFAAELSGVSQEQLTGGLSRLARNAKDARDGVAESVDAFGQLGISVTGADGQLKGTTALLGEIADKFQALPDGIEKTAAAQELFGRSGAGLINLLNGGSKGLEDFRKEAEQLGLVLDTQTAEAAERFNDNLARFGKVAEGAGNNVAAQLLPVLVDLTDLFVDLAKGNDDLGEGFIKTGTLAGGLTQVLQGLLIGGSSLSFVLSSVGKGIGGLVAGVESLARLDVDGFTAISDAVREDISRSFEDLKAFQVRVFELGTGQGAGAGAARPTGSLAGTDGGGARKNGGGKAPAIPSALTDPINEQLVNFLRSEKDAYAEIDAYLKGAAERATELGSAITDPIEQIKVDFLASEKAAYDQTDADVLALLSNIEKLDARTEQFLANVQDAFGETLLATFKGTTDGILENWGNLLLRMVSEAAAADLVGALTGKGDSNNLATLGSNLASIVGSLFGGGRAIGGPARRGQLVEVNEFGGPGELFSAGGKQYLMPSQSGVVTPTAQRPGYYGGGAAAMGGVQNNIIFQTLPGTGVEAVSERTNDSGGIDSIFRMVDKRMAAGVRSGASETDRAFRDKYNMSRGPGAPRRG